MSILVSDVIDYARRHVKLAPLLTGGSSQQPALSFANDVLIRMLSYPYRWKWNRAAIPAFNTSDRVWAYPLGITDYGWLERAYRELTASTSNPKQRDPMKAVQTVQVPMDIGYPDNVAVDVVTASDVANNALVVGTVGSINVIRLDPMPDATQWTIYIDYQKKPPTLTDVATDDFDPVPDELANVVRQYFVAFAFRLVSSSDFQREYALAEQMLASQVDSADIEADNESFAPERPIIWPPY